MNFNAWMLKSWLLAVVIVFGGWRASEAREPESRVLLMHSYSSSFRWTDQVTGGFLARLTELVPEAGVEVAYLDFFRPGADPRTTFENIARRVEAGDYDVVAVCDDDGIELFRQNARRLPAEVPVVFLGWVGYDPEIRREFPNSTGLIQPVPVARTIELALQCCDTPPSRIVVIVDRGPAGERIYCDTVEWLKGRTLPPVDFWRGEDYSSAELFTALEQLPADSLAVYTGWYRAGLSDYVSCRGLGSQLAALDRGAMFATMDNWLGQGMVGGVMCRGERHGREAADLVGRLLAGSAAAELPFAVGGVEAVVDWPQLRQEQLTDDRLPDDVVVVNRPPTIWEQYRRPLIAAVAGLAVLIGLLAVAAVYAVRLRALSRRRRQEERQQLAELQTVAAQLRMTLHSIGEAVIVTDAKMNITLINPVAAGLTGCAVEAALGRKFAEVWHIVSEPDDELVVSPVERVLETGTVVELAGHTELTSGDGGRCRIAGSAAPIHEADGALSGVVVVFRDVSGEYERRDRCEGALKMLQAAAKMANLSYFCCNRQATEFYGSCPAMGNWEWENGRPIAAERWIVPEDLPRFREAQEALLAGRRREVQVEYRSAFHGGLRYFRLAAELLEPSGEKPRIFGILQDVTATAERERQCRDTDALLKTMVEALPCLVFIKDLSDRGRYLVANRYFAEFLQRTPEEMVGKTDGEIFNDPELVERFRRDDSAAMAASGPIDSLERVIDSHGRVRYLHGVKEVVRQPDGRLLLCGIAAEITEMEEAKRREEEFRRLLQAILDNVPVGILLKDPASEFRYVIWNKALARISGVPAEKVIGKTDFEADIYPFRGCAQKFREEDMTALRDGTALTFVEELPTCLGSQVVYHTHKIPLEFEDGRRYLLGLCVNISKEWLLERDQREVIAQLNAHIQQEKMFNRCLQIITIENDFDRAIEAILANVCDNRGADRCFVFRYSDDYRRLDNCYEWTRDGIASQKMFFRNFEIDKYWKLQQIICSRQEIAIDDVARNAEWRQLLKAKLDEAPDVQSLLLCGIWDGDRLWGIIGMDFVRSLHPISGMDREVLRNVCNLVLLAEKRKRQVELVADSVSLRKQLVDNISIPIAIFDHDFRVVTANAAAAETVPMPLEELIGSRCYETLCGQSEPPPWCPHVQVWKTGQAKTADFVSRGHSFRLTSQPIFDRRGEVQFVFEAAVDMTDPYRQQEALEQSRNQLQLSNDLLKTYIEQDETVNACMETLVFNSDFADALQQVVDKIGQQLGTDTTTVFRMDAERHRLVALAGWARTEALREERKFMELDIAPLPLSWNELYQKGIISWRTDRFREAEATPLERELQNYLLGRRSGALLAIGIYHQGRYWGHIGAEFIAPEKAFEAPETRMMHAAARIIEVLIERERVGQELARSEAEKKLIFNMLEIPLVLFDCRNNIVRINPAAARMVGRSEAEIMSEPCYRSFCQQGGPAKECSVRLTLQTGQAQLLERKIRGRIYRIATLPFLADGKIVNVLQSFVDITEVRQQQEQLQQAMEDAQAADRAKSFFLATMSHEIRTPLNAVIGFSELLQNQTLAPEEQLEYLQSINFAGMALLRLINDILDLSKIEAGQMKIVEEKMDFVVLCREINAIFSRKATEKRLTLQLLCPDDLPLLCLDGQRVRQILLNLIGNAIKFTERGTVALEVHFQPGNDTEGKLTVDVRDTGIGISPEYRQKIFQPFVQDDNARNRAYEGTGLGLSICQRLIRTMGGELAVESELGKGSCFSMRLTGVRYEKRQEAAGIDRPAVEVAAAAEQQPKILLVDDVAMNLKVLNAMLRQLGAECLMASSGEEALRRLDDFSPELVLTDLWMPGMNGAQLAAEIRRLPQGRQLVLVAVTADTETDSSFSMVCFDGVLRKPVSLAKLRQLLDAWRNRELFRRPDDESPQCRVF